MAASGNSSVKPQKIPQGFVRALASAVLEWLLILLLFVHAIFSYLITIFAHCCELQTPCLLCSRLDHVLGNKKFKNYWDLICSSHKLEISSLVLCHAHNKLVDVHGMCENCLLSYATINKSNAETYRLLVGKVGEDSSFSFDEDPLLESYKSSQPSRRQCSCCNEPWIARGFTKTLTPSKTKSTGSEPAKVDVPLSDADEHNQHDPETTKRPSIVFRAKNGGLDLSHVGYTELKVTSDSESEVVLSDDDDDDDESAQICEIDGPKEDPAAQCVQPEPPIITLSHDSALKKLVDPVSAAEPSFSVSQANSDIFEPHSGKSVASTNAVAHGLEELNWEQADVKADPSAVTELISFNDVPPSPKAEKTSVYASNESQFISMDDASPSSNAGKNLMDVSKENKLIYQDILPSSNTSEFPIFVSKGRELCSVDEVLLSSNADKSSVDISEECKLISLDDGTASVKDEKTSIDVSNESKLISVDDVLLSSTTMKTSMDVSKETQLIYQDIPLSSNSRESPVDVSMERELIFLDEARQPSHAVQTSVDVSEEGKLVSIHDTTPSSNAGDNPAEVLSESKEISLDHVLPSSNAMVSSPEPRNENSVTRSIELGETSMSVCEEIGKAGSVPNASNETAIERNPVSSDNGSQASYLLDLSDAYKVAVGNRGRQLSGLLAEQWIGKDSSRVSEDLKLLLSQLSAARGFEQLMTDMSPKVSVNSDELKTSETSSISGMQILQRKMSLERNESGFESLDGSTVSEIEGESVVDRLKRQVEHDKKLLSALYKELEEERNASTVAVNQAMAMITRLQEEKASLHMEALQSIRMMEEQAEYDMEALQKTNDLLAEKEKEIQDLEEELLFYRKKFPNESMLESVRKQTPDFKEKEIMTDHSEVTHVEESVSTLKNTVIENPKTDILSERVNTAAVKNSALEFEDEKLYIIKSLKKLEKKLYMFSYNGLYSDLASSEYSGNDGDEVIDSKELNFKGDSAVNSRTEGNHLTILNDAYESRGSPRSQGYISSPEKLQFIIKENSVVDCYEQRSPVCFKGFAAVGDEISDLNERLEALESDQNFLELTINSLKKGQEGIQFIQEIAYHLRELRRIGITKRD